MLSGVFVTGTDTGVGKTRVALGLMEAMKRKGFQVSGMKPVATGCRREQDEFRNEDALLLRAHASSPVEYSLVNPYALSLPVSPHIAASQAGVEIDIARIQSSFFELRKQSEFVVVEGVGGWEVPLNATERVSDLARALGLPVLLVVGLKLGCLNHAFLTSAAIQDSGCEFIGWVGNRIDRDFPCVEKNLATLRQAMSKSMLGSIPFEREPDLDRLVKCFAIDGWIRG